MNKTNNAISPTRKEDYPKWYQQVIKAAELAEPAAVRGCMVIKPWGYAIWENIQKILDRMIKETGHQNIYCPLFVPLSFLEKEASHVAGFAKECAVVTHHRLAVDEQGKLQPTAKLEEPLIVRPTSEAIVGELFAKWIQSYRDLPLLTNQWANIVRWEMRPRLFLRTTEFLWQEGHTVHATANEAREETEKMLAVYAKLAEDYLAMPVIPGEKTAGERFPGAVSTYCIEAMMQDGKGLQAGTSHYFGQNFSKAFNIRFLNDNDQEEYGWTTSWGVTTRLIGGIIMTHSDDDGLILPPKIAPIHIVILPLIKKDQERANIMKFCEELLNKLQDKEIMGDKIRVKIDDREMASGDKAWGWVKKGVPIRIEIGGRELTNNSVFIGRRDYKYKEKITMKAEAFVDNITNLLIEIQTNLFVRAKEFLQNNMQEVQSKEDFYDYFDVKSKSFKGFVIAPWAEDTKIEEQIKQDLKVTARCIPNFRLHETGKCIFTGKKAPFIVFGRSY